MSSNDGGHDGAKNRISSNRRTFLKATAVGALGTVGFTGSAAASHWHTDGPHTKTDESGYQEFEICANTYQGPHDNNLIPFGIMWGVDQGCSNTGYEVRNLTIKFDPYSGNPSDGDLYVSDPWDDKDQEEPPDVLDYLEILATEVLPTTFSIVNAANDNSIDQWTESGSGGPTFYTKWNETIFCDKHSGVDIAWYLDPDGFPSDGTYWFWYELEADIYYTSSVSNSYEETVTFGDWHSTEYDSSA